MVENLIDCSCLKGAMYHLCNTCTCTYPANNERLPNVFIWSFGKRYMPNVF